MDFTDEKRAGRKLRGLFEAAPDSIVVVDRSGRIVHLNSQSEKLFGYRRMELIGRSLHELVPQASRAGHPCSFERFFAKLGVRPMGNPGAEVSALRKDGTEFAASISLGHLETDEGAFAIAFVRDATEERRVERTVRKSEAYFRVLSKAGEGLSRSLDFGKTLQTVAELGMPDFADYCVVATVGDDGTIRAIASSHLEGIPAGLVEGFCPRDTFLAGAADSVLAQVFQGKRTIRVDFSMETEISGAQSARLKLAPKSVICVPLLARENVLGVLCWYALTRASFDAEDQSIAEDLGHCAARALDNALLHEQLGHALAASRQATDAARRATEARDELLAIVAHDLCNPLNAIVLRAQLLLRSGLKEEVGSAHRDAALIISSAHLMTRLIEDLLALASFEAGFLKTVCSPYSTSKLVTEVVEAFASMAAHTGLSLTAKTTHEGLVLCDPARVQQILGNLISNAMKFTPEGGSVSVEANRLQDAVSFSVIDNGAGIPPEACERIFDRNWRAPGPKAAGLGLGLYIARALVEAQGGKIRVDSHVGTGSTFTFSLPLG